MVGFFDIFLLGFVEGFILLLGFTEGFFAGLLGQFFVRLLGRFVAGHPGRFFPGLSERLVAVARLNRVPFAGLLGWFLSD